MASRITEASQISIGTFILIEGEVYAVRSMDISKTGKHGHAKCRFDAISVMGGKKKVMVVPGHERFEVPMIEKRKAQILSIMENKVNVMDMESFENFELEIPEEFKEQVKEGVITEYWVVEGQKVMKKVQS